MWNTLRQAVAVIEESVSSFTNYLSGYLTEPLMEIFADEDWGPLLVTFLKHAARGTVGDSVTGKPYSIR